MKQSEDTENDNDVGVTNASDPKDGTVIDSKQLPVNDAAGSEANHAVVATIKKNEDIAGVKPADGGEFEDADESSPQIPNGKRERPPPSTGAAEAANNEPALSRPRTMDDNSKQPAPYVPAMQAQTAVPTAGVAGTAPQPQQQQMTQNTIGMQPPPQLGFDPNAPGGGRLPPTNMAGGANALFAQGRPLRDMQFPQRVGALPENAMMSQHLLNQQLMMGGQGQLPLGFAGNPVALGQFSMGPFNGQFPSGGAPQGGFPGQVNPGAQGQEGAQPPGADPNATPNTSQQQGGPPNNTMGGMPPTGPMPPGPGGPVGQMGFGGFGGRPGGMLPVMGFSGMPPGMPGSMPGGAMPDAALQQMMFQHHQRQGGLTEADAMRQRMMMASGIPPGAGGFHPSFLAAAGGRLNNMNAADLRVTATSGLSASPAVSLALACDDEHLSEYQIMVRKQLEVFEAQPEDVESNTQGRKKQVSLGQVGIRCKHCASLPLRQRGRGAVYYPAKLQGVYQAAQNMASSHLCESCQCIDEPLKAELRTLRERRDTASGGKQYWADGARALGLFEADDGLRLNRELQQQQQ